MLEKLSFISRLKEIPRPIWALGFVSMLMDISSEMIQALLPVYMVTVMGSSMIAVGVLMGLAEATGLILRIFSGAFSDWLGKRKLLTVIGYGLSAITKPIFPLAPSIGWIFAARFIDRVGKGIRDAPRDALIADITPAHLYGASYGLRQSLDSVGAFIGPAIAILLMWVTSNHYITVFWAAVIPALMAVLVLMVFVKEPPQTKKPKLLNFPLHFNELRKLSVNYWMVVFVATLFTLARFSEAFLILRAQGAGLSLILIPLVLIILNVVYALTSYPAGVLSDKYNRIILLAAGFLCLILANFFLAFSSSLTGILIGVALWGVHMGLTQGIFATLIADTSPIELRGTGFGIFNLLSGLALLCASVIAGVLWESYGAKATFIAGAFITFLALLGLFYIHKQLPKLGVN
jgi:MFS family permease